MDIRVLGKKDHRASFRSGVDALDEFFHRFAGQNQFRLHIGVTYVAIEEGRILGYATVSMAVLDAEMVPGKRALPRYPMPVLRVARLATDLSARGQGLGSLLLAWCGKLAVQLRDTVECIGLLVDAKDDAAVAFYAHHGF